MVGTWLQMTLRSPLVSVWKPATPVAGRATSESRVTAGALRPIPATPCKTGHARPALLPFCNTGSQELPGGRLPNIRSTLWTGPCA
jgi:hypothetical protein